MVKFFSKILTPIEPLNRVQDQLTQIINPMAANPLMSGILLTDVSLPSGAKAINHTLGRNLVGWFIVRQRSAASIYDQQDSNKTPSLTLALYSSAAVSVDIFCF